MAEEYREDMTQIDETDPPKKSGRKSKAERWAEIHENALVEFGRIQSALRDERLQCLQDRRFAFIAGAQWEGPLSVQFENKPRLEVNKTAQSIKDIIVEYRNNRIDVTFMPKDGSNADEMADACAALFRSDEQDSTAEEAYDNAFEELLGGGFGAWRLRTEYEDEEDDENGRQRIRMEPIFDADSSVWFDLDAKRQDKSDARCCFVLTALTREEYHRQYPDEDMTTWPKIVHQYEYDWLTPAVVYIAEYYLVENTKDVVHFFQSRFRPKRLPGAPSQSAGSPGEKAYTQDQLEDEDGEPSDLAEQLKATGYRETRQKKINRRRIHKWLMNGMGIIEDCGFIAGKEIPIIPAFGKRCFVDNVERCMGHVRLVKDAQRILNMQLSKLAEISALSTVAKPIMTPEQVAGFQNMWEEDNIVNRPYLLVNPAMDAAGQQALTGPVGWTKPPEVPAAMAALVQLTNQDMEQMLGNPQQAEKQVSHVSGRTVEALAQRLDGKSMLYIQNMGKAIRRCGQVWLSMAAEVYTEESRKMKGIGRRGERSQVQLMKPMVDPDEGGVIYTNDLSKAKLDVAVDIGPSSKSKRDATVRAVTNMLSVTQDPETQAVLSNMALMNMEGEGIEDIRKYSRMKLIKMGVVDPTPEEAQALAQKAQNAPPDPNAEYIKALTIAEQAKAQKEQADLGLIAARTEKTKADTIVALAGSNLDHQEADIRKLETLAGIDLDHMRAKTEAAESLHGMLTTPLPEAAATSGSAQSAPTGGGDTGSGT